MWERLIWFNIRTGGKRGEVTVRLCAVTGKKRVSLSGALALNARTCVSKTEFFHDLRAAAKPPEPDGADDLNLLPARDVKPE